MNILCIGSDSGTSKHRRKALERLGHEVEVIDPRRMWGLHTLIMILIWKFSGFGLEFSTYFYVRTHIKRGRYDFCIVDHGETVSPLLVRFLKKRCDAVVLYNADNPFVERDKGRWRILLKAVAEYDTFCTPRESSIEEAKKRGAKHVIRYIQTADEIVHKPKAFSLEDEKMYASDVAFVGTWMPERGPLIAKLLDAGINVKIFGAHWHKAPEIEQLKSLIVIDGFLNDEQYVRAIQYSKISLGLVSIENKDLHTHRSAEVPAIGTAFSAQRTSQHLAMYDEGVEAVFWDDADECARVCLALLSDPAKLKQVAERGHQRVVKDRNFNEPLMERVVRETLTFVGSRAKDGQRS